MNGEIVAQERGLGGLVLLCMLSFAVHAQSPVVHATIYLDVKPTSVKQGIALLKSYVLESRAENGNDEIVALQEIGRPNRLVIMETWKDADSLVIHEQSANSTRFRLQWGAIQRSPCDERVTHGFLADSEPLAPGPRSVYVVTHVDVPSAKREEAEKLLRDMVGPSRLEPGHVLYDVYQQNQPRMNHFTLFAIWRSQRTFDGYGSSAAFSHFTQSVYPMLGALYDERVFRFVQ